MRNILLTLAGIFTFAVASAQDSDAYQSNIPDYNKSNSPTPIGTNVPPPPNPIPIDGGVGLLLVAGVGYGLKKVSTGKRN